MTSPKRVLLFSIALLTALALGAPSGALAETGLDASYPAVQPDGVLVAQARGSTGSEEPRPTGDVKIPDVVGKHINAGGQILLNAGLDPVIGRTVITSNSGLDRKVESQSPRANQTVPAGTRVTMTVYQFKPKVPNVVGKSQAEAERVLEGKGLRHQVAARIPTPYRQQADKVASQSPEAGKTVAKGTKVLLFIPRYMAPPGGGGPPPGLGGGSRPSRVSTPHVIGMPQAEAERVLRDAGFGSRVRSLVATRDQSRDGRVRFQQPPPGMPVIGGTTVALDVYKLQDVRVPNVVGMSKTRAMEELRNASLIHRLEHINTGDSNKDGIVDAQAPREGNMVPPGTSVVLKTWLYTGVRGVTITGTPHTQQSLVKVPRVEGMPVRNAVVRLSQVSLKSKTFDIATEDAKKHGMVGAQVPKSGRMVAPGTEVRLGVWWYQAGSAPPSQVNVPGVLGVPKAVAVKALTDAGFGSRVKQVLTGIKNRDGRVKAQAPSPGTPVNLGTTVALDVWEFREGVIDIVGTTQTQASVQLPNVIGMTKENAKKTLEEKGFTNVVVEDKYITRAGFGSQASKVDAQDPPPFNMESTGRRIDLTVLNYVAAIELVRVPSVTNLKLEEAKKKLWAVKLNYHIRWVNATDKLRDLVVGKQSPQPSGTFMPGVRAGTVVNLDVFKYSPLVLVPNVIGMHWKDADRTLKAAGLPNWSLRAGQYNKNAGVVARQSKNPGTSEFPWRTITLDVQEAVIRTPGWDKYEGKWTVEQLRSHLWNKGWRGQIRIKPIRPEDIRVFTDNPSEVGKINAIWDPDREFATIRYNQDVTVMVYLLETTAVPNLRNQTFQNAKARLNSLILKSKLQYYYRTDDKTKECKVKETSPSPNSTVGRNSTVNLTVWRHQEAPKFGGILASQYQMLGGVAFSPDANKLDPCPGE